MMGLAEMSMELMGSIRWKRIVGWARLWSFGFEREGRRIKPSPILLNQKADSQICSDSDRMLSAFLPRLPIN
jgi:hypothetical protein